MVDTTIPYQIVIFMQEYCISGGVYLKDQRLSDYLNDKRETNITLRNASIAKLEEPTKPLGTTAIAFIPKSGVVMVYEPPQQVQHSIPRFIKYPKEKYSVFFVMDGMEARGEMHMQQALDLHKVMAEPTLTFLPITQANVTINANSKFLLNQVTVVVNLLHIRFIGEIQVKPPTQPRQ
jgi:hypothetical protein